MSVTCELTWRNINWYELLRNPEFMTLIFEFVTIIEFKLKILEYVSAK